MAEIASFGVNVDQNTRLAQNAQDTADNAASDIDNLNDPNLMSVIEKQTAVAQYAGLTSQYNVMLARAKDDNISTTDLTTAYTNLNTLMADILTDTTKASDIDRHTYNSLIYAYNTALSKVQAALKDSFNAGIDNMSSSVSVASQAASSAVIVASQAAITGDNANQVASQAVVAANEAKSAGDNATSVANNASQAASGAILAGSTATVNADKAIGVANEAKSAGDNASQAVDSVAAETSQAIITADSVATTASQAIASAGFANDTANEAAAGVTVAKSDAANALTSAATAFNAANGARDSAGVALDNAKSALDKVTGLTADISKTSSTVSGLQTNYANLQALATGIQTTVGNNYNDLKSQVSQTNSAWQVALSNSGQTNLIYNSEFANNAEGWTVTSNGYLTNDPAGTYQGSPGWAINQTASGWTEFGRTKLYKLPVTTVRADNTYSASALVKPYSEFTDGNALGATLAYFDSNQNRVSGWHDMMVKSTASTRNVWTLVKFEDYQVPANAIYVGLQFQAHNITGTVHGVINHPMITSGPTVGTYNSDSASQADITALADDINLKVNKGDVVNQINVDSSGILIDGKKVHITGETSIDNGIIGTAQIANGAINSAQIGNEAVGTAQIGDGAITNAQIANGAINSAQIGNEAVGTAQIGDGAITNAKIGKLAVGTAQIGDGAITNAKIGKLAVGTAQIANAAITDAQVGNVSANKLTAGTIDFNTITGKNINASSITTGKLDTDRLNVNKLSALSANLGDVTTGSLKGVDIVANTFSTPNGSFTTDANGSITANNMTLIGGTLTSSTINTPNLNLGDNGQLTGSYSVNDDTSYFQPINGTGSLKVSHGYIQSTANILYYNKILNGIGGNKWGHWESSTQFVPAPDQAHPDTGNVAESTLTPAFLKLDIFNADYSSVNSRAYIDGTGLYINSGGTESVISMLSDYELLSNGMAYLNSGIKMKQNATFTFGNLAMNGYHSIAMLDGKAVHFQDKPGRGAHPIEVEAKTFTKSSRLSIKHDITPLSTAESSRLLNAIDVEKFRYTHDGATYKYQYGGVIDDVNSLGSKQYSMPSELLSEDGTGINLDSLTGILIKTVQEQERKIGKLSMRLTRLEMEK